VKRPDLTQFEVDALVELHNIDTGWTKLTPDRPWGGRNVETFTSDTGWKFGVFNDAGGWDYLEWIEAPDGRRWAFADGSENGEDDSTSLQNWSPVNEDRWLDAPVAKVRRT